jgi:hypothetical protein
MARPGLVDRQGLLRWAGSYTAGSEFPRLIRRLILQTGTGVAHLGFPAGEGVLAGSWDGTVRSTKKTAFIPRGLSYWELSVRESDYKKRTPIPDATYVAAYLRPWVKRKEWAEGHAAEGRWKGVCAYGVDDIETWLESAPVTHAWISEQLGYEPHGLVTADTWWQGWSNTTTPPIPFGLLLTSGSTPSRAEVAGELKARLAQPAQIITVRATSTDEVLAFCGSGRESGEGIRWR